MDAQNFEQQKETHEQTQHPGNNTPVKKGNKKMKFFLYALLFAVIVGALYFSYVKYFSKSEIGASLMNSSLVASKYSAVFLDNGDVYFGKLSQKESTFVVLKDAYYLRVTQKKQTDEEGNPVDVPQLDLVKLGSEVHKPVGIIEIQRGHILSIQELAPDSQVIEVMNAKRN